MFRPQRGNSITPKMGLELKEAFQIAEKDPSVRVIILTGSGKFFCTGMDLGSQNQEDMKSSSSNPNSSLIDVFEQIKSSKKPVISKINGPALGGGWGLIFTTDIRLASPNAYFSFAEVKRGLVPAIISAYIVPEIGAFKAKYLMLTGQRITSSKALELGLITDVVRHLPNKNNNKENPPKEDEDPLEKLVESYVQELLEGGPQACGRIKSLVSHVSQSRDHQENLKYVQECFAEMINSPEAHYGMSCFLQKQKPDWSTQARL